MGTRSHGLKLVRDLFAFAWAHKAWWLVPTLLVTLLLIGLVVLSTTPVSPFVYTIF